VSGATYSGRFVALGLTVDPTFQGPLTIPADFLGIHNTSLGSGHVVPSPAATATASLDAGGRVTVTMGNHGGNYYDPNHHWTAVVFSGGDGAVQTTGYPVVETDGTISSIQVTSNGNHVSVPPTVNIVRVGGPNIPALPSGIGAARSHDYRGSGAVGVCNWYYIDPSDGSGNYNWSALDEFVCWHAANGRSVMYGLHGTPTNYATTLAYTGVSFENQLGASAPLNAAGLVEGIPNEGLWGFITAMVTRYNINANALTNPVTGLPFSADAKLLSSIEVGNEFTYGANGVAITPSNGHYWIGTAQQHVDMVRIVNLAAAAIDPDLIIYVGGFTAGYPMGVGTDNAHHFSNYLTAVDSIDGKSGWYWMHRASAHPYDLLEDKSHFLRAGAKLFAPIVPAMNAAMIAAGGSTKPIAMTEWGFYELQGIFQTVANETLRAVQIVRCLATHAKDGVACSFPYDYGQNWLQYPSESRINFDALSRFGNSCPGKTIIAGGVLQRTDGGVMFLFSDGTSYFTW
jgi:hypothetical protein